MAPRSYLPVHPVTGDSAYGFFKLALYFYIFAPCHRPFLSFQGKVQKLCPACGKLSLLRLRRAGICLRHAPLHPDQLLFRPARQPGQYGGPKKSGKALSVSGRGPKSGPFICLQISEFCHIHRKRPVSEGASHGRYHAANRHLLFYLSGPVLCHRRLL